ncbi:NAD-dependent epimerase/dehydratase family protein [Thermomonas sp. HDW16]|uniref:NAD-dependent epimerase/dehydratase family protein n=1 Tax=Thermomonas sp. HDW16 TaxID=2714945 RepID=UPI00140B7690|nr:NAD-dependent epimerase/dehydratase family protein [Thermomonas sp. HDW16]QIL20968.1 NAD-dependent epimerase/dehydratase family protein [Thermomonas sp. HDW16]
MATVLITGGSGFIGSHAILQALAAGHDVRTTVRSLQREGELRALLHANGADADDRLRFFAADLTRDAGWADAAAGCDYVLHIASPFPTGIPKHEDELIVPARDGALRALRAARDAGVKRVVLTSSFAAIGYGHPQQQAPFDETTWTNLDGPIAAYTKSKTLAERAAWDFIAREGGGLELSVVNPVGVFGPVLGPDYATSIQLVQRLMDGALPGCPKLRFGVVDVRDVVDLHLRAMTAPAANGERFLAVAGSFMRVQAMALALKARLGDAARKVPTRELPSWLVRLVALADPTVRQIVPDLDKYKNATADKARRVLGWSPRSNEDALAATAESLLRLGLLKR